MPFFIHDQKRALGRLHAGDPQHADLIEFLGSTVDRFAAERLAPRAAAHDEAETFDPDTFRALGSTGFMALQFGEDVGGLGAAFTYAVAGLESLAKADAGFTLGVAIHGTTADGIYRYGSEALRQRYVPGLVRGELIGCFGLTEPDSGSDARALRTTYRRDGDSYLLSGTKYWITNGPSAQVFFIIARDSTADRLSAFVVEPGWAGTFEIQPIKEKMGVRGSNTAMLVFEDYRVPAENLVGEEGNGFKYAMHMLNGGRVTVGGWSTGVAQGAYEKLLRYAHERQLFGKRLIDLDNTKRELSEMLIDIHTGRVLSYAAALDKTRGLDYAAEAAIAKVAASEAAVRVGERAIELAGGYGYVRDSRIERHLRDALLARIGEGANELLKIMVIPRVIEKRLAAEPTPDLW
ncbi:MAG TPA: acyl-CoA dehydrogenase family protein [Candidatus Krumholzibacteria bacterium]|jgi:butyryl-CoA dehydrogenase|nr:acyl-CoA dehydrogenase family protein [Candidatus Krumholzibacteria bacterium]